MRYILIKTIPNVNLKIGDIIDSNNEKFSILDLTNKLFFTEYKEQKFELNSEVLYDKELYIIKEYLNLNATYLLNNNKKSNIPVKENKLIKPTFFWFINSDGEIHRDYLERKSINMEGIKFKKITDNYFLNKEDAIGKLKSIMNKALNK